MKLDQLPGNVNLTYCTNIHAGESWPDIRASLDAHVPAIKAAVTPDRPLGIGLRLSGEAAAVARQPEALDGFSRATGIARRLCLHHQRFPVWAIPRRARQGAGLSAGLAQPGACRVHRRQPPPCWPTSFRMALTAASPRCREHSRPTARAMARSRR